MNEVYDYITDGSFTDDDDSQEDIKKEFDYLYGDIARKAQDLRDEIDIVFDDCETVSDCKDAISDYFADFWER